MELPSSSSEINWQRFYGNDADLTNMVKDAYDACTNAKAWVYLQTFTPTPGVMLIDYPIIDKITKHMKLYPAHSGHSLNWTFEQIIYFAKNGIQYP